MALKKKNHKSQRFDSVAASGMALGGAAWKRIIREGAASMGVSVSSLQADLFALHAEEMAQWNRKVNITAIRDPFEVAVKHFLDSCAISPQLSGNERILDIGTGGGFPGVPLSVLHPNIAVHLVDASRKKVSFLNYLRRTMGAANLTAHHARVENLREDPLFLRSFDVIVSRAFSELALFVTLSLPFLKNAGRIIAMKGPAESDGATGTEYQVDGIRKDQASAMFSMSVFSYSLPYLGDKRSLVVLRRKPEEDCPVEQNGNVRK